MDERKRQILQAIIDDYILTAMPVGSRTISRKYFSHLSSATIRNEMSDLEDLGYLMQPHVSAGRVPNAKAYRLYVDLLLESGLIDAAADAAVQAYYTRRMERFEDVVASTAQVLSDWTHYASVVMMPRQEELRIATLQLVPVSQAKALLVIITDGGIVRDTIVHVSKHLDTDALYAISRMLTERFSGMTLREVQSKLDEYAANAPADPQVIKGISELSGQMDKQNAQDYLTIAGSHNILSFPEYQDVGKARTVLSVLEEKGRLMELIRDRSGLDVTVRIGPETGIPEMLDCSVVLADYQVGNKHRGTIGVIGPTRMPYARVMATLRVVCDSLSFMLSENRALQYDQ